MIADLHRFRPLVIGVVVAFALGACTADPDTVDGPTGSPVDATDACQAPPLPPPPSESQVLDEGCITVTVAVGEPYWFDGDQVLQRRNIPAPSCPVFGSSFSWQVTSTGQPPVTLLIAPQGDPQPGVSGATGTIDGYCGTVAAEHTEATEVTMDLRYVLVDDCPDC